MGNTSITYYQSQVLELKQNDVIAPRRVLALYRETYGLAQLIDQLVQKARVLFKEALDDVRRSKHLELAGVELASHT